MRRVFRAIALTVVLLTVAFALGFGPLFLQDQPILDASPPPKAQDVAAAKQLIRNVRAASNALSDTSQIVHTDAAQLNSVIRLGARFIKGFRGRVTIEDSAVLGEISVPVPWWTGQKWLNVSGTIPEFDQEFSLNQISVGRTNVPPKLAVAAVRIGANRGLGNRFGDKVLQSASAMVIQDEALSFSIELDDVGKNGVMRGVFGSLRGQEMPGPEEVEYYHLLIRDAMQDGTLSQTGSFLPYIQFTLAAALKGSTPETLPNAYTAALFGLTKICGARDFAMIVGQLAFDKSETPKDESTTCSDVTFNNRIDSRRHFITSAAIKAASNRGFAVSIGEFKELNDTISGAGGFDFTDLAANNSGIRMSDFLMPNPPENWPALLNRIQTENDVIIRYEGIPQIMREAEFKSRFRDVESSKYKAMLAVIDAKIDQLGLYQSE
jgi:hypothetical protein